jgi:methylenetetrahydrofolate reductase (NADPH)
MYFDIDSMNLLHAVRTMRDEGKDMSGFQLDVAPQMFIGAAENPFADPFLFRAVRLGKKVAAGADFTQTQIVYNVEKFAQFMEMVRKLGLHKKVFILAGVSPIKSVGAARYMKTRVPGMDVPDWVVERMAGVPKEDAKKEGIRVCVDIIKQVKHIEGVAGVHIMAIEWEDAVAGIVEAAGLLPRPKIEDLQAVSAMSE